LFALLLASIFTAAFNIQSIDVNARLQEHVQVESVERASSTSWPDTALLQQSSVTTGQIPLKPHIGFMRPAVRDGRLVDLDPPPPAIYDEQLGLTFTQNFTSIAYNVTAVQQVDSYGYGPAYLLNGLTDKGYWYQVGLSFDWPYTTGGFVTGFYFNYEVFNNTGKSIFPASGGGLESFSGPVNNGDNVLLYLYFSSGSVMMYAYDWSTYASAEVIYTAVGGSYFQGQTATWADANGFFTGLMTEWWHPNAYYGSEAQVVYNETTFALSSGWLWADEWVPSNETRLFSIYQYTSFSNPTQLQYFSTNGASEAASAYLFITGTSAFSVTTSPSSATLDIGQSQLFTSSVSGGTSPFSYQWYLNGVALGVVSDSFAFSPASEGTYSIYATAKDNSGLNATSNTITMTVNPTLVATLSFSRGTIDVDQSVQFTASASVGTPTYSYQWYLNGSAVQGATSLGYTFTSSSAGVYKVSLVVQDAANYKLTLDSTEITVNPALAVSISGSASVTDVDRNVVFTASDTGGTQPISLQWYVNGTAVTGATSPAFTYVPTSSGTFDVYVVTTDGVGFGVTSSPSEIRVNNDLLITSFSAAPLSSSLLYSNNKANASVSISGGSSPYTYEWYLNGVNVDNTTLPSYTYVFSKTGEKHMKVKITDSAGYVVESSVSSADYAYNYFLYVLFAIPVVTVIGVLVFVLRRRALAPRQIRRVRPSSTRKNSTAF
jgi:hypothetical protein